METQGKQYGILVPRLGEIPDGESCNAGYEVIAATPEEAIKIAKELPGAKGLNLLWEDAAIIEIRTFDDEDEQETEEGEPANG